METLRDIDSTDTSIDGVGSVSRDCSRDSDTELIDIRSLGRSGVGIILSLHLSDKILSKILPTGWLDKYEEDPDLACKSIYELILHCAGYKSKQPLADEDFLLYHEPLYENFAAVIGDLKKEPLLSNQSYFNRVASFITESFSKDVLTNHIFMDKIYDVLHLMIQLQWKPARYTGAVFMCIIVRCYAKLVNLSPNQSCQYPLKPVHYKLHSVELFKHSLVVCLVDTHLETRKRSLELYYDSLVECPSLLMDRSLLRNVLWAICDENQTIRIFAIRACCDLIEADALAVHLQEFLDYVFNALLIRIKDKTELVAVEAFKALSLMYKKYQDLFVTEHLEKLFTYIYCGSKEVSLAAGEFLYLSLDCEKNHTVFIDSLIKFVYTCECSFRSECAVRLIRAIFPVGQKLLTNWTHWSNFLFQDDLEEGYLLYACFLLIAVLEHCTTFQGEPCQFFPKEKMSRLKKAEKIELYNKKLHQTKITTHFGPSLIAMWEHFKDQEKCLPIMLKIAKFCDIDLLNINEIYRYLVSLKCESECCIEEVYSALASVLRSAKLSDKWKDYAPDFLQEMINDVGKKFSRTCVMIASNNESPPTKYIQSVTLLKAVKITKYFDVTQTGFNKHAFEALKFGIDQNNAEITLSALRMCCSIVQWKVTKMTEGNHSEMFLEECQNTLHENILKLMPMLRALLLNEYPTIRLQAYFAFCKIYILFSPLSEFVKKFPVFKRPKPSLVEVEWLNFTLHMLTEQRHSVQEDEKYLMTKTVLRNFCLLITTQVLPLWYLQSILPYFSCFRESKRQNYNTTLEAAFTDLSKINNFLSILVKCLESYCRENSVRETEEIAEGIIHVHINKLPKLSDIQRISMSIIGEGLNCIKKQKNVSFFVILSHFAKLMAPNDAAFVNSFMMRVNKFPSDNEFVKNFVDDLKNRSVPIKLVPATVSVLDIHDYSSDDYC